MRQGWTLSLFFEVGQFHRSYGKKKTKFMHEVLHAHGLGMMVGLATQSVQYVGVDSAWRHEIEF